MDESSEVASFHAAEHSIVSSSELVRPKADEHLQKRKAMGRFEHGNKYQVLSMEAEDEDESDNDSLAEPLVDSDVEISDPEVETDDEEFDQRGRPGVRHEGPEAAEEQAPEDVPRGEGAGAPRARLIKRPIPMTKAQRERHIAEGHVNYHPGCEFCARTRGRPEAHRRKKPDSAAEEEEEEESEQVVPADVPTVSFDFCFLSQLEQEKSKTRCSSRRTTRRKRSWQPCAPARARSRRCTARECARGWRLSSISWATRGWR